MASVSTLPIPAPRAPTLQGGSARVGPALQGGPTPMGTGPALQGGPTLAPAHVGMQGGPTPISPLHQLLGSAPTPQAPSYGPMAHASAGPPPAPVHPLVSALQSMNPQQVQAFHQFVAAQSPAHASALAQLHALNPQQAQAFQRWTSPAGIAAEGPSAAELAAWQQQRQNLNFNYGQGMAANQAGYENAYQNLGDQMGQLNTLFDRRAEQLPAAEAHRGMLQSGIYNRDMQQGAEDRAQALYPVQHQYEQELQRLLLGRQGLEQKRALGLAGVANNENLRRDQLAQLLRGLK
jgi:hypothetical protein